MSALYTIDRYEVRPDARDAAARAMHEHATWPLDVEHIVDLHVPPR